VLSRLAIALTALLTLVGATVVAGYLFLFAVGTDRLANAVPADTPLYATVYLQPSTGQKMNLATLLGHVPGFADAAGLDQKLHEISARFLGQVGIDYEADVRPWIGNQVSLAAQPGPTLADPPRWLLVASVKDQSQADAALDRIAAARGLAGTSGSHEGVAITVADGAAWALLEDLLIVAPDETMLTAALDAELGRRPSLGDSPAYAAAMRRLPADHLAAVYVALDDLAAAAQVGDQASGYSALSAALLVEPDGVHLRAIAPFDAEAAPTEAREAFALASEPSSLADWMPADTQAAAVFFRLSQSLQAAEDGLAGQPEAEQVIAALSQLRAVAAFGLGINLDNDVLPLFDSEVGLALSGLTEVAPSGHLLLRPSDPQAAKAALDRIRQAVVGHGGTATDRDAGGVTVTTVDIPQVASLAWAMTDDVIVAGLTYDDVAAALAARSGGQTLAENERYRSAWELAGDRGGNEAFVNIGAIADASGDALDTTGDARDILLSLGAIGFTAPARADATEIHVVLTVR
jgi:uncharacterized protein DUF3352